MVRWGGSAAGAPASQTVQTLMQHIELHADAALSATQGSDFTAVPAVIQADLHDGRSLTETIEPEPGKPPTPPSQIR